MPLVAASMFLLNWVYNSSDSSYSKSGLWGITGKGQGERVNEGITYGSQLYADGDVNLISKYDTNVTASYLGTSQGNDINIHAGYELSDDGAVAVAMMNVIDEDGNSVERAIQSNINITGAEQASSASAFKKKKGFSFSLDLIGYKKTKSSLNENSTEYVGSFIASGGDFNAAASNDINVVGSDVQTTAVLTLNAGKDINVLAGRENLERSERHKSSGFGLSLDFSNGFNAFLGYKSEKSGTDLSGDYTASASLDAGTDLSLIAGEAVNQLGSHFSADNDLSVDAQDLISLAAYDRETIDTFHESLSVGITATVSSSLINSAKRLQGAIKDYGTGKGGGLYETVTNLAAITNGALAVTDVLSNFADGYANLDPVNGGVVGGIDKALGLTANISFGFDKSSSETHKAAELARVSSIEAGNDIDLTLDDQLLLHGTQVGALNDITIRAEDILLQAAVNTSSYSQDSESYGASVGVGGTISVTDGFNANAGVTVSGYYNTSDYFNATATHVNAGIDAGNHLSIVTDNDLLIHGGNLHAETADLDVGGNLDVLTKQNTSQTDGGSFGVNASVTFGPAGITGASGGLNFSDTDGHRVFSDTPSTIITEHGLDITVDKTTSLSGAMINSQSGDLSLSTGDLQVSNLVDEEELKRIGGGINLSTSSPVGVSGISFDYENKEIEGITRATIGEGVIEIRNPSPQEADALLETLNRDPQAFQDIFKNKHVAAHGSLDIQGLLSLPDNLTKIGNFLKALATPVPDKIAAMGPEAEKLFLRMIANGISEQEVLAQSQTADFARAVQAAHNYRILKETGADLTKAELQILALSELAVFANVDGELAAKLKVECGLFGSCEIVVRELKEVLADDVTRNDFLAGVLGDAVESTANADFEVFKPNRHVAQRLDGMFSNRTCRVPKFRS